MLAMAIASLLHVEGIIMSTYITAFKPTHGKMLVALGNQHMSVLSFSISANDVSIKVGMMYLCYPGKK